MPPSTTPVTLLAQSSRRPQLLSLPLRTLPVTFQQTRNAGGKQSENALKYRRNDTTATKKKKKERSSFKTPDPTPLKKFALCDAMRYIRAFEVGRQPTSSKYDMAVRLKTVKNAPVLRNRIRLPHAVDSPRLCVIAAPGSKAEAQAKAAGAVLVGEENVFEVIKDGRIEFDRCICHVDSVQKLNAAGVARILGPKGLMPNLKRGTVVQDIASACRDIGSASEYREKMGVVRMAIGQLAFTPEEMQKNVRAFMGSLQRDIATLSDKVQKEVFEVVLSSTNAPGFTLNGEFRSVNSVPTADLSTL